MQQWRLLQIPSVFPWPRAMEGTSQLQLLTMDDIFTMDDMSLFDPTLAVPEFATAELFGKSLVLNVFTEPNRGTSTVAHSWNTNLRTVTRIESFYGRWGCYDESIRAPRRRHTKSKLGPARYLSKLGPARCLSKPNQHQRHPQEGFIYRSKTTG
jgi:hypothetical protein